MKHMKIILSLLVLSLLIGCAPYQTTQDKDTMTEDGIQDTQTQQPATAQEMTVDIRDFAYSPQNLEVDVGTTVTWTNYDSAQHTATSDEEGIFDSGLLSQGESWSYTFNSPGEYPYHCTPHPYMEGLVVVS